MFYTLEYHYKSSNSNYETHFLLENPADEVKNLLYKPDCKI